MSDLAKLTNHKLRREVRNSVHAERKSTIRVLDRLDEVERRRLHLRLGFRSMFAYCTKDLKYSESAAIRRIAGARTLRRFPEARAMIADGDLSLTNLLRIVKYLGREDAPVLLRQVCHRTKPEMDEIIAWLDPSRKPREFVKPIVVDLPVVAGAPMAAVQAFDDPPAAPDHLLNDRSKESRGGGKNLDTAQNFTAAWEAAAAAGGKKVTAACADNPEANPPVEPREIRVRRYKLSFSVGESTMKNIEKARRLVPGGSDLDTVVSKVFEEFVERHDPERRAVRREERRKAKAARVAKAAKPEDRPTVEAGNREGVAPQSVTCSGPDADRHPRQICHTHHTRHIPIAIRDEVWRRDGARCTYIGSDGRRCDAVDHLELDHIEPFACGGEHTMDNLRLLCGNHNRFEGEMRFGRLCRPKAEPSISGQSGRSGTRAVVFRPER